MLQQAGSNQAANKAKLYAIAQFLQDLYRENTSPYLGVQLIFDPQTHEIWINHYQGIVRPAGEKIVQAIHQSKGYFEAVYHPDPEYSIGLTVENRSISPSAPEGGWTKMRQYIGKDTVDEFHRNDKPMEVSYNPLRWIFGGLFARYSAQGQRIQTYCVVRDASGKAVKVRVTHSTDGSVLMEIPARLEPQ